MYKNKRRSGKTIQFPPLLQKIVPLYGCGIFCSSLASIVFGTGTIRFTFLEPAADELHHLAGRLAFEQLFLGSIGLALIRILNCRCGIGIAVAPDGANSLPSPAARSLSVCVDSTPWPAPEPVLRYPPATESSVAFPSLRSLQQSSHPRDFCPSLFRFSRHKISPSMEKR